MFDQPQPVVVSILVILAVAQLPHQFGGGVADIEGNRQGAGAADGLPDLVVGGVNRVAFGGGGQIEGGLSQGQLAFRTAQQMIGVSGLEGEGQGLRIGEADIFGGKTDQPPGDVEGLLAGHQHPDQPVEGAVGVAVPQAFMKGGDQVVVFFPVGVVAQALALQGLLHRGQIDNPGG